MIVIKRDGSEEAFNPSKIQKRILDKCKGLKVNGDEVAIKVISGFADRMTTVELDSLAAETAATMMTNHPDYSYLASRIAISRLHKETDESFRICMMNLRKDTDLLNDKFAGLIGSNWSKYNEMIVHERDYNFDYFGYKTLERAYLLRVNGKVVERPQYLHMRVAVAMWEDNLEMVKKVYDDLSQGFYIHATPTLFNAGTKHQQLSSCFLIGNKGDDKESLMDTAKDVSIISSYAGGIGLHVHDVRAEGSLIHGSGGKSNGLLPMLRTYNELSKWWDQGGGKRKGSFAIYLEPWHKDIEMFIDIRKNHGKEELRARELFPALWIPDLFMQRVEANSHWTLFCPNEILRYNGVKLQELIGEDFKNAYENLEAVAGLGKKIEAQSLWTAILTAQMETGTPYLAYKDAVNLKSNQQNLGVIKSSNLCVAPETQILTSSGYYPINELENEEVNVWNGKDYSKTTIIRTSESSKLLKVTLSNGQTIDATEYHKWYVQKGYKQGSCKNKLEVVEKRTFELEEGDKLIKLTTPVIEFEEEFKDAYTQGVFSGDGCHFKSKNHIDLYGEKKYLANYIKGDLMYVNDIQDRHRITIDDSYDKYEVPSKYSIKSRLDWFAGLCDTDGCLLNNNGTQTIQIASAEPNFLLEIQLMLQTLGVNSKVLKAYPAGDRLLPDGRGGLAMYSCRETLRLNIGADSIYKLLQLGFKCHRLNINSNLPNRNAEQFVKVLSVEDLGRVDVTYCANESKEHKLVFNGVITGNCIEINEYSDAKEQAVCNLASLALPKYVIQGMGGYRFDHKALYKSAYQVTLNLNRVIDINYYPTKETEVSNLRHRPIGIGVQGLADVFAIMKIPFDSEGAKQLNKDIFETIYYGFLRASATLASRDGRYETFNGSPASKGNLQFDMWGVTPSNRYDWKVIKEFIINEGLRNSLGIAPMPTASTSQILGYNECFEPFNSNLSTRRTLAGDFIVINKYLIKNLEDLGLWNPTMKSKLMMANGSVQNIEGIPNNIKAIYKTAYEISQKVVIDMAADRGAYVCQGQSMNLFVTSPTIAKLSSMHFYGWKKGLKTGMYYLRTKAAVDAIKGLGMSMVKEEPKACNINNPECEACGS